MKKVLSILLCVCLLITTVLTVPMVSAEETATEYFYHFNDFESLTNEDAWLAQAKQGTTMTVENGANVIGGSQSLKTTSDGSGNGYVGFALSNVGVPVNVSTRVSFDYKITVGTKGWSGVGYIGHSSATNSAGVAGVNCYNWANVNDKAYSDVVNIGEQTASTTNRSFKNIITRNDKGDSQPIGIFYNDNKAASEVIFDNLVIAEIIETVAVANSDETKGTVTVANKAGHSNYAVNETAVFTATPAEGYSFAGWYNGDVLVSTEATYEHTLTTDITLTAKWKLYEKEYDYKAYDYENGFFGDSFPYDGIVSNATTTIVSEETENPVSGNSSYKYLWGASGTHWAFLTPKTAENKLINGASYHVSGKYVVQQSTSASVELNLGTATAHWQTNGHDATALVKALNGIYTSGQVYTFNGKITTVNAGYPAFHTYTNGDYTTDYVLLDDIVYAQVIDTVSAVSADEAKGTATVANKNTNFTDFAVNETAVFTATPAEGYSFAGWYNGDTLVSTEAVYEHTLVGDTTLTAKWKLYEKEYQYIECDYENLTDYENWFSAASDCGMSLETENSISGSTSLKVTASKTGYIGFPVIPTSTNLKTSTNYRISGSAKVTAGSFSLGRIGSVNINNGKVNPWDIGIDTPSNGSVPFDLLASWSSHTSTMAVKKGTGILTTKTTKLGSIFLVEGVDSNNTASILIDDIIIAEIIDTVTAVSSDETKGAVTVANKAGYNNYAKNEIAVFTAIPVNGYYFVGWYDKEGNLVSTDDSYETVVYTDTTLTAKFDDIENPIQISFNSNGGSEVETIIGVAGAKINMPTAPTKEGFTFAGWYTDKDCTEKYPCKVFPEADTTLYAKWINGIYQNFENFTSSVVNAEILDDIDYSYDGTHSFKAAGKNATQFRVIVAQNANEKLSAFADIGDEITISFKYKLVSGSVNFYPHTATQLTNPWSTTTESGFNYYTDFTEASEEWKTFTHTYTLNSLDGEYVVLLFTAKSDNTEIYVDDVLVYKTIDIPVNYSNEAVRLEPANANKPLTAAIQGDTVEFKAVCDASVIPTVKYGENELTPVDGIYTITVTADDELTVTTEGVTAAQNHVPGVGLKGEDLTTYNADVFSTPVWEGDTVYHEAVMFVNSSDGTVQTTKKLLYPIDDIISVRNDDLNKWYVKGVDFKVEDGKLVWLPDGKCPIWTKPLVVPQSTEDENEDPALSTGGSTTAAGYYKTDETNGLYLIYDGYHEDKTVYVTYKHSTTWDAMGEEGYTPAVPENQSYDMQKFYNKLDTGNDVNVLVYGDSVATGCASTGANVNYDLFDSDGSVMARSNGSGIKAPTFFEQATNELVKKYGNNNKVNYYNIALGGMGSAWGAENLTSRVDYMNAYYNETITPDIIYVKFAANDIRLSPDAYKTNMSSIVAQFKELYPDATIVLVSGKINNEKTYIYGDNHNNVLAHEKALAEIADANVNCVVAKTTSIWASINQSKDYEDYLSNNINHANDFWAMVTSQIIVESIAKDMSANGVTTMYNSAAALRSAANSTTGKNGLRIYNEIKRDWIQSANIVEFGSIAIFSENLGEELTLQVSGAKKGVAYKKGQTAAVLWESTDGVFVFTSYLTNIKSYDKDIVVRSYAIDAEGNVYYGAECVVSVFAVANAMDNGNTADGSVPSEIDVTSFAQFVTEENKQSYLDWCLANNKFKGELFDNLYS